MRRTTAIKKLNLFAQYLTNDDLVRDVAKSLMVYLENYTKAEDFFNDLFRSGCSSGIISELIYYVDTYKFFDDHYSDIMDLVEENKENGLDLNEFTDLKNSLAWFAYEETARKLAQNIGIEV